MWALDNEKIRFETTCVVYLLIVSLGFSLSAYLKKQLHEHQQLTSVKNKQHILW
jgi:hypothetical protein